MHILPVFVHELFEVVPLPHSFPFLSDTEQNTGTLACPTSLVFHGGLDDGVCRTRLDVMGCPGEGKFPSHLEPCLSLLVIYFWREE